jgi:hypothetical protein
MFKHGARGEVYDFKKLSGLQPDSFPGFLQMVSWLVTTFRGGDIPRLIFGRASGMAMEHPPRDILPR